MTSEAEAPSVRIGNPSEDRGRHRRAAFDLFLISFVILFLELTCIRWFGSTVIFLTFFTNLVLMACFLGMTVGCLTASRTRDYVGAVFPLTLLAVVLAAAVLWGYERFSQVVVDVGQQQSPQQIYFGTETRVKDSAHFVVPIELVAGVFFTLIALIFVGLGQVMGRAFNAIPRRGVAYAINLLGSMAGIAAFGLASYERTPPLVWFAIGTGLALAFVRRWSLFVLASEAALLGVLALLAHLGHDRKVETTWSPYYKVQLDRLGRSVFVNNILHQIMNRIEDQAAIYSLPHLLNRDAGGEPFEDVLVVGAGSGNDVSAALAHRAGHVDAVEIDPVIAGIGKASHPNRPYADPRVSLQLDDGRSFVRGTSHRYDLAVYALVDSLVLHSGYSSLRLESFLFTEQAFRDIKAKLKPGGVFVMYNYFRQGWVVGRLVTLLETVFGTRPLVISLPYKGKIDPEDNQTGSITMLVVGPPGSDVVPRIRQALERGAFWSYAVPKFNEGVNGYGTRPPSVPGTTSGNWFRIGPAEVQTDGVGRLPTDDWPFLYLRSSAIPALNLRGIAIVALLSTVILLVFAPVRTIRPNGPMFFLGAGFMLLETKGVVHMALLFGSTWVVNSIVFFAVLVMTLLSNLYVLALRPRRLWPYYGLLFLTLLVNAAVPMTTFLALPGTARIAVSCLVVMLPVFFAGVVFASLFRESTQPDVDFGSNIGGVILGGLSENLSLVLGFDHLLLVAIAFYVLSAALRRRGGPAIPAVA